MSLKPCILISLVKKKNAHSEIKYLCADESYLTNGYLDTVIDWIPGMKDIRLKDLPSLI